MVNPDAGPLEATTLDGGVVDGPILDLSVPDVLVDVVAADASGDGSALDVAAGDGAVQDGPATNPGDGEAGDAIADTGRDGTVDAGDAAVADASDAAADVNDAAVADAAPDGPPALCATGTCPPACTAASEILLIPPAQQNSGSFATTGTVCVLFHGSVNGWGVSNADGRTVTAIGATTFGPVATSALGTPPAAAAGADGFVYWVFTAGTLSFSSMFIF